MKIRLNSLKEGKQELRESLTNELLNLSGEFEKDVLAVLSVDKGASEISIHGTISTEITMECDRCLETFQLPVTQEISILLSKSVSEDDEPEDSLVPITDSTYEVDITDIIRDTLLLGIPMKHLCREDCKGLCSKCGVNLNSGKCQCETDQIDPRWEALKKLNNKQEDK